jgi:hypothetical protein
LDQFWIGIALILLVGNRKDTAMAEDELCNYPIFRRLDKAP